MRPGRTAVSRDARAKQQASRVSTVKLSYRGRWLVRPRAWAAVAPLNYRTCRGATGGPAIRRTAATNGASSSPP